MLNATNRFGRAAYSGCALVLGSACWLLAAGSPMPPGVQAKRAARPRDPALEAVLTRVSDYIVAYGREMSAVVAEEVYEQRVTSARPLAVGEAALRPSSRRLVSDYLLVQVPGTEGWTPFRDVFEVDGVQVRDRDDRLKKLFLEAPPGRAAENANKIWIESARYNIGGVQRNINVPTFPLMFVAPENLSRFEFSKAGEPTEAGIHAWEIAYREVTHPTIVKTSAGADVLVSGTFRVDPLSGRVLRTILQAKSATITVTYRPQEDMGGLWLPATMKEYYPDGSARIDATATYSKFRKFQIVTEESFKPPKQP